MIPILICDDDTLWTQKLSKEIERFQIASDWEVCLTHVSHTPEIFLQYLRQERPQMGIYLLDIDLQSDISGMELGKEIRRLDSSAQLIFITTHDELVFPTLSMGFGVCNFIIKDQENWREQLHQTFQNIEAFFRSWNHPQTPSLTLKCGSLRETLPKQDIYFITSIKNTHRFQICSKNGYRDVPLSLTELEKQLGEDFVLCRRDCLVNLTHIQHMDHLTRQLTLDNQEKINCSIRGWKSLKLRQPFL